MSAISEVRTAAFHSTAVKVEQGVSVGGPGSTGALGRVPQNVLQGLQKAGDAFSLYRTPGTASAARQPINWPGIDEFFEQYNVSQLDKAEALAQDAFAKVNNPNANFVDKLQAQEEMQQADQIRKSVEGGLSPLKRQAVDHINSVEQNAVKLASNAGGGVFGSIGKAIAGLEMAEGAQDSKSLDNWILSE